MWAPNPFDMLCREPSNQLPVSACPQWVCLVLLLAALGAGAGCRPANAAPPPVQTVFTPAHDSIGAAFRDFFNVRPVAQQPFPFPHKTHAAKNLGCTDYCHEAVTKGPRAGLPSIQTCMGCHEYVATDRPLIQQLTAHAKQGRDFSWARVYGYAAQAHVRFNHAPHIRADVACATCHGPVDQQGVVERTVDMNMGFCVDCHRSKRAPNECITCHY